VGRKMESTEARRARLAKYYFISETGLRVLGGGTIGYSIGSVYPTRPILDLMLLLVVALLWNEFVWFVLHYRRRPKKKKGDS